MSLYGHGYIVAAVAVLSAVLSGVELTFIEVIGFAALMASIMRG